MIVSSISDLYFISAGLYALAVLTGLLIGTGIFLLPFAMMIVTSIRETSFEARELLGRMEMQTYTMLFVFIVGFYPLRPLTMENVYTYSRVCETAEQGTIDYGLLEDEIPATDLTVMLSGKELKMPMFLELALKLGTGLSFGSISELPCSFNLQGMANNLMNTQITNPRLRAETKEFVKQCYKPALNQVARSNDNNVSWIEDPDTINQPWPGHPDFMNDAYYSNTGRGFYSQSLIPGFQAARNNKNISKWFESWKAEKDGLIECGGSCLHELGGFPSCQEWWLGVGAGFGGFHASSNNMSLRERLYDHVPDEQKSKTLTMLLATNDGESSTWYKNKLVERSFFNSVAMNRIENAEVRDYGLLGESVSGTLAGWFNRFTGTLGNTVSALPEYAGASLTQLAAPIIKGAVLLVIITAFPLVMVISKFDIKMLTALSFLLGSVMLWPFFWELTILLQKSYIETVANQSNVPLVDLITQPNVMLLSNRITDALFIGFPVFVTSILSYAGLGFGSAISGMAGVGGGTASAGAKGTKVASKAGQAGVKAATKGAAK
ncbi:MULTISPECIES: conjugal transfer protein TraG N-terminal domain-containing protein [Pseudoalteromonas]|uniref:conjugal transfer protein TraG N-terminal domain-containing protein n=1 Tax=Pseudoalteromonas TaxID=53246 RepID=UPI0019D20F81|nr:MULTISPECIES: conjugal transfer protein TraG N-terminal domain-containing protein [Pseudoalteromonas]MBR8843876.1 conjugal transfer protein TraG N-terminal domain-containing protein [Pseudoalteromonas sp. JC3]UDM60735.1 conjugal transfer protein TraG N-terminal domain-containing protein [Pseudoalteromonas piscicida]WJE08125.1 conjugal transfer protein TraG N-terminal domain-containing protein [Pseudoalteromonas sp. JC3]